MFVLQATCNPVAYSLISDYFSTDKRATALSVYHVGVYIGKRTYVSSNC